MDRSCDNCTKCCEGHLTATIYGFPMYPGKPCHFMTKTGCGIYSTRPIDPCKGFKCVWKREMKVPLEMKPDIINMIMIDKSVDDISYVYIVPAEEEITLDILDWAVRAVNDGHINNIVYEKNGKYRIISHDPIFINKFNEYAGVAQG